MRMGDDCLIGKQINDWTIISYSHKIGYCKYYVCRCKCGKEKPVAIGNIISERSKSCGCSKINIGNASKKYNDFYIYDNVVRVKMSNSEDYMLCDVDDWNKLKNYCWHNDKDGYVMAYESKSNKIRFHRAVMNVCDPEIQVDHIDGNPLNNRKINLRICNNQENSFNKNKNSNNTSGYKGVYFDRGRNKWRGAIQINGKSIKSPKRYNTPEEAYNWYIEKSNEYFKDFSVFKSRKM